MRHCPCLWKGEDRPEVCSFSCPLELLLCGPLSPGIRYCLHHRVKIWRLGVSKKAIFCWQCVPMMRRRQQGHLLPIGCAHDVILKFPLHCESLPVYCLHVTQQSTVSGAFSLISFPPSETCLSTDLWVVLQRGPICTDIWDIKAECTTVACCLLHSRLQRKKTDCLLV